MESGYGQRRTHTPSDHGFRHNQQILFFTWSQEQSVEGIILLAQCDSFRRFSAGLHFSSLPPANIHPTFCIRMLLLVKPVINLLLQIKIPQRIKSCYSSLVPRPSPPLLSYPDDVPSPPSSQKRRTQTRKSHISSLPKWLSSSCSLFQCFELWFDTVLPTAAV